VDGIVGQDDASADWAHRFTDETPRSFLQGIFSIYELGSVAVQPRRHPGSSRFVSSWRTGRTTGNAHGAVRLGAFEGAQVIQFGGARCQMQPYRLR
jgi:hypothetical protein